MKRDLTAEPATKPAGGLWGKTPASRQRRRDILMAAKTVFLEDGYQLASMERLAAIANTTKRTLYDHFGNKQGLFTVVIAYCCELFVDKLPRVDELAADPAAGIAQFIARMAEVVSEPNAIRFQRSVIAEADRHPEFSQQLSDAAFAPAEHTLRAYLEGQIARGALAPHDVASWARVLIGLATNLEHVHTLLGVPPHPGAAASAGVRDELIALYVAAHRR